MNICVTKKYRNGEQKTTYSAEMRGDRLSFENINDFINGIEKINKMIYTAEKQDSYVELEIIRFDYCDGEKNEGGHMVNYDRWEYKGYPANDLYELSKGERGLYFTPDKKYTPENHDMWYDFTLKSITA